MLLGRGSSPLARGLQRVVVEHRVTVRIIPARAGFTASEVDGLAAITDHPRSRGVYNSGNWDTYDKDGSSPLARGLPSLRTMMVPAGGIIPARAGFTPTGRRCPWARPDHPRSRGVYAHRRTLNEEADGSSPLARGLPTRVAVGHRDPRIIPARAGFTSAGCRTLRCAPDHPRSRGVYRKTSMEKSGTWGSSPLARGLLDLLVAVHFRFRIIPARAGFTL